MNGATGYRLGKRAVTQDRTRQRITGAAERLYLERWYDDVSLREVAGEAGVALQTVVNHFGSKGGLLAAVSYRGLKSAVFGLNSGQSGRAGALVKFFTRHAILALAAYAMLARLRLPAWAIAAGASSLVVAVAIVAARSVGSVSRPGNPR